MAIPVAKFVFKANDLSVQFTDRSSNIPTSWSWNFGDGTALGTTQNPSHTYALPGVYDVSLTATNADGGHLYTIEILVDTDEPINLSIEQLVRFELPAGITFDENNFAALKYKWQLHLQPLTTPKILDSDVMDETKWPTLVNVLIAKLIVYDMVVKAAQSSLILGSQSSSSSSEGGSTARGPVKSIETGPTKVEFLPASEAIKQLFGNGTFEGSPFGIFMQSICALASRLRIKLAMCGKLAQGPVGPIKGYNPSKNCHKKALPFWPPDGFPNIC